MYHRVTDHTVSTTTILPNILPYLNTACFTNNMFLSLYLDGLARLGEGLRVGSWCSRRAGNRRPHRRSRPGFPSRSRASPATRSSLKTTYSI